MASMKGAFACLPRHQMSTTRFCAAGGSMSELSATTTTLRLRTARALTISPQGPSEVSFVGGPMRTVFGTTGPHP